jgi:DNA-binding response OmpR family regulator
MVTMPSAPPGHDRRRYMIGPLEFAPEDLCVTVAGKRVWLTRRELEVLEVLAENAGRPVARDAIHRHVWGGTSPASRIAPSRSTSAGCA